MGCTHRDPRPLHPGSEVTGIRPPHGDIQKSRSRKLASDRPHSTPQVHQGPMLSPAHRTQLEKLLPLNASSGSVRACLVRMFINPHPPPSFPLAFYPFLLWLEPPGTWLALSGATRT